jgi:acyl-CoA dehydrogenase
MGKTDPDAVSHRQQTMVLVPTGTPGVRHVRSLPVFGRQDQHGHDEIVFDDVRVPVTNVLGEEGGGFAPAQARLGRAVSTTACGRSERPGARWP